MDIFETDWDRRREREANLARNEFMRQAAARAEAQNTEINMYWIEQQMLLWLANWDAANPRLRRIVPTAFAE